MEASGFSIVPSKPKSISELSTALYAALDDVQAKKLEMDKSLAAAQEAQIAYDKATSAASELRYSLDEEMNKILPQLPQRVRHSG